MKLYLQGHSYKYAVEQIMLMMFPEERPEYPEKARTDTDTPEEDTAFVTLSRGREYCAASVLLFYGEKESRGASRVRISELTDKLTEDRLLQKIIKIAFYKAAVKITGAYPVWGALTGIRPGKIATKLIEGGRSPRAAARILQRDYYVSPERAGLCTDTAEAGLRVKRALGEKDIAIYVGIPFCPTRCAYCSFVSHSVEKSIKLIPPFLEALYREIEETARLIRELGLNIISVYMGGGTPTTLSAPELDGLLSHMEKNFDLSACREYTVEAGRPDTITEEKLETLLRHNISRISINPQTMSDEVLKVIGRRHTAAQTKDAFELARRVGMDCINMDLIAGLPSDTAVGFRETLDKVLEMGPENVTVHTLSLKKGTRITLEGTPIPSGDTVGKMLDYASERLRGSGYSPYYLYRQKFISGGFENVGWAKENTESLYNILIMEELCSVLALGGGGSTKLVAPGTGRIIRIFNAKYPAEYINGIENIIGDKGKIRAFYENEVF